MPRCVKAGTERERCAGCDKRRVVKQWYMAGGVVGGLVFPACGECVAAGWRPELGRDYFECSEEEWDENLGCVLEHAVKTGQI